MGEDLPETINEVALDPDLTDAHGIPAPLVRYRLSDNSRAHARLRRRARRARCSRPPARPDDRPLNPLRRRPAGTCSAPAGMGDEPYGSVVDGWGRAHDVPNLFIVDGSVFVTSAAVNPTPTIQALALRTADYIRREGRNIAAAG